MTQQSISSASPRTSKGSSLRSAPSHKTPGTTIQLNKSNDEILILASPSAADIRALLADVEKRYVASFWEKVLCADSPYDPTLPLGLAAWKTGIRLIKAETVESHLSQKFRPRIVDDPTRSYLKSFHADQLREAIKDSAPESISEAKELLTFHGIQRLNAFDLLKGVQGKTNLPAIIRDLTPIAARHDGPIAVMALVAMRSASWVALSRKITTKIAYLNGLIHNDSRPWNSPFLVLSPNLRSLYLELMPSGVTSWRVRVAELFVRIAVLSTNMKSISDFNWGHAVDIFSTNNDQSPHLRKHWRSICRKEEQKAKRDVGAAVVFDQISATHPASKGCPDWKEVSNPSTTQDMRVDEILLGGAEEDRIIINQASGIVFLLRDVSKPEVTAELAAVEKAYVERFWAGILRPSPFNTALPYGLAANATRACLFHPVNVFSAITGHSDLNGGEALKELRKLPLENLQTAIKKLGPVSVAEALPFLSVNGANRFRAKSLVHEVSLCNSFREVLTLLTVSFRQGCVTPCESDC
jgi:hypothetical protein